MCNKALKCITHGTLTCTYVEMKEITSCMPFTNERTFTNSIVAINRLH